MPLYIYIYSVALAIPGRCFFPFPPVIPPPRPIRHSFIRVQYIIFLYLSSSCSLFRPFIVHTYPFNASLPRFIILFSPSAPPPPPQLFLVNTRRFFLLPPRSPWRLFTFRRPFVIFLGLFSLLLLLLVVVSDEMSFKMINRPLSSIARSVQFFYSFRWRNIFFPAPFSSAFLCVYKASAFALHVPFSVPSPSARSWCSAFL